MPLHPSEMFPQWPEGAYKWWHRLDTEPVMHWPLDIQVLQSPVASPEPSCPLGVPSATHPSPLEPSLTVLLLQSSKSFCC